MFARWRHPALGRVSFALFPSEPEEGLFGQPLGGASWFPRWRATRRCRGGIFGTAGQSGAGRAPPSLVSPPWGTEPEATRPPPPRLSSAGSFVGTPALVGGLIPV